MPARIKSKLLTQNKDAICFFPQPINEYEVFVPVNIAYYDNKLLPYYIVSNMGRVYNIYNYRFLSPSINNTGIKGLNGNTPRYYVNLQFVDNTGKSYMRKVSIHRLMMISFNYIEGCEGLEVDHVDGVYHDNFLPNLEWVTKEENIRRAIALGLRSESMGQDHYKAKYTEDQVIMVCQLLSERRYTHKQIAELTNTSTKLVANVHSRKNWVYISKYYVF